ncbi:hypothetical protein OPQ81_011245 [Rhizoctonia solani]|nr:hypothetical protein OPQ81_011245 [Rhizoctonia solani]
MIETCSKRSNLLCRFVARQAIHEAHLCALLSSWSNALVIARSSHLYNQCQLSRYSAYQINQIYGMK